MNNFVWTFEDVQEIGDNYNSNNSSNIKDVISNTINNFKSKLLGILSPNITKTIKKEKIVDFYDNKKTKSILLTNEEKSVLFTKLTRNKADISKLKNNLLWERNLLSHFEKIAKFIPGWAITVRYKLNKNIKEIEDKLIELEIQNLKINDKLNPFEKDKKAWDKNIFNNDNIDSNNVIKKLSIEEKMDNNIAKLETKLDFEKKLYTRFQNLSWNHDEEIKKIQYNIDEITDNLIKLKIQKLKMSKPKK